MKLVRSSGYELPNGDRCSHPLIPFEETEEFREMKKAERRDELVSHVLTNKMTPEDAEKSAKEERLGPLSSKIVAVDEFTPDMTYWSIEMTSAWISERTPRAVHRHYERSYEGKRIWAKTFMEHSGGKTIHPFDAKKPRNRLPVYALKLLSRAEVGDAYIDFDGSTKILEELDKFFPDLRLKLIDDEVSALGEQSNIYGGNPEIACKLWAIHEVGVSRQHGAHLRDGKRVIFRNIRFRAKDIVKSYPPVKPLHMRPVRLFPWKPADLAEPYKEEIIQILRSHHPAGLPDWRPKKVRDANILDLLPSEMAKRWWKDGRSYNITPYAVKAGNAFQKAMDRLFKETLESEPIPVKEF